MNQDDGGPRTEAARDGSRAREPGSPAGVDR